MLITTLIIAMVLAIPLMVFAAPLVLYVGPFVLAGLALSFLLSPRERAAGPARTRPRRAERSGGSARARRARMRARRRWARAS